MSTSPLVLTPHPLQRVGAAAVAHLAGRAHIDDVTWEDLDRVSVRIQHDAVRAAAAGKDQPGSWWQRAMGATFPNSPATHPGRAKRDVAAELAVILDGPSHVAEDRVPCALCGRDAQRLVGKDHFALAASIKYRNTTARGVGGWPLCRPCLVAGWALPYGAAFVRGQLVALDSVSSELLMDLAGESVHYATQAGTIASAPRLGLANPATIALRALRTYGGRQRTGVNVLVLRNDNRGASLQVHRVNERRCAFIVGLAQDPKATHAMGIVSRFHTRRGRDGSLKDPGVNQLARFLLMRPDRDFLGLLRRTTSGLEAAGAPTHDLSVVRHLANRYAKEVLLVRDDELTRINQIGARVAEVVGAHTARGPMHAFTKAMRSPGALAQWFRREALDSLLRNPDREPLLTTSDYQLLQAAGPAGYTARDLLFFAVIASLHERGWGRTLSVDDREELADEFEELLKAPVGDEDTEEDYA